MAFELGTYGSAVFAQTPAWSLPEPGDSLTWDWMNSVGEFSQRFRRMATVIATIADGATQAFDYSALRNDYFPPYLRAYYYDTVNSEWLDHIQDIAFRTTSQFSKFVQIGLGTARFINHTGASRSWLLLAYL